MFQASTFSKHLLKPTGLSLFSILFCSSAHASFFFGQSPSSRVNKLVEEKNKNARTAIGVFVTGDFLYWKAEEDALSYTATTSDASSVNFTSEAKEPDFNWNAGFRLGAGYTSDDYLFSLSLNWTNIRFSDTSKAQGATSSTLVCSAIEGVGCNLVTTSDRAQSKWRLKFDMLDLSLKRPIDFTHYFTLTPQVGLKGGWIDQKQDLIYSEVTAGDNPVISAINATKKNDFASVGPSIGLSSRWGTKWGFFGEVSGALLYGYFNTKLTVLSPNSEILPPESKYIYNRHRLRPMVQALLGVDWTNWFDKAWSLSIKASYETQYFWNQWIAPNNLNSLILGYDTPNGDLFFKGFTLSAGITF